MLISPSEELHRRLVEKGFHRLFMPKTVHHDSRSIVPVSKKHCSAAANVTAAPSQEIDMHMHDRHAIQCFVTDAPRF